MVSADNVSTAITTTYFSIYLVIFFVASIYCAYEVEQRYQLIRSKKIHDSNKKKDNISKSIQYDVELAVNGTTDEDELKEDSNKYDKTVITVQNVDSSPLKRCKKFAIYWAKSLWTKKSIYISIVPHLFDQATDLGVIYTYYEIWQHPNVYKDINNKIEMISIFYASIAIIIMHKIISCGAIYALTKNKIDVFLQFIDLMMVKAIYLNYKLNTNEPGNAQRYLQILEGTFESGPQILVATLFIVKTYNPQIGVDPIILISTISSIWTLTSRVTSDDKFVLKKDWKSILVTNYKFPYINYLNWRYLLRVICWRFCEISSRVFILVLLWVSVGGFSLIIIMVIELLAVFVLCYYGEGVIILGNMMYYTIAAVGSINSNILDVAATYKLCSPFIFLILITVFSLSSFEAWKVEDYMIRRDVVNDPLKLSIFVYSWIASIIWIISVGYTIKTGKNHQSSVRDCESLFAAGQFTDVINLIEFGSPFNSIYPSFRRQNVLKYIAEQNNSNYYEQDQQGEQRAALFRKLYESNIAKSKTMTKNCLNFAVRNNIYLTKYLVEELKVNISDDILNEAINHKQLDIIKYLLVDVGVDMKDVGNGWCFRYLVINESMDTINYLATKYSEYADWCMYYAVRESKLNIIKYLINNTNVNINKIDDNGESYLFRVNNTEIFKYLVDKGIYINKIDDKNGENCLFNLIRIRPSKSDHNKVKELLKYLVDEKNAKWTMKNGVGHTLVSLAKKLKNNLVVDYLESIHNAKGDNYSYDELLYLWGFEKCINKMKEYNFVDTKNWKLLINDDKKLQEIFQTTHLIDVSQNQNLAKKKKIYEESKRKMRIEKFKENWKQWQSLNQLERFKTFYL